ncbi:MAG: hypothetical protein DWQ47_12685 [Acidobacteria bacterium]|nr:MAG: hypothetical protein DWQ32_00085 [Acidobacteriota bacterium]REK03058.1 MAG: hypothetical protein DWQ38_12050 [Acidobacteriota bacterium]REK13138.1 MAG: hypothetical protein DWQ43_05775 [Acidobacteriota bacterium]REK41132.1 MAG: hypothetical protein DWQ47_12685 [Acidobacteriota bacterium]
MQYEWRYERLGDFTYNLLPEIQVRPFLIEWLIPEWDADRKEFPDQPWTAEWLELITYMNFTLEVLSLDVISLRPDLMAYRSDKMNFADSLAARANEREESLLRGVSTEPLVVNADGLELMDGYTRYEVFRRHNQKEVYAYVGKSVIFGA